ncbi:MAG TPA: hypothetical protein VJA16_11395 [Thermoanaerobaculia bacterium]
MTLLEKLPPRNRPPLQITGGGRGYFYSPGIYQYGVYEVVLSEPIQVSDEPWLFTTFTAHGVLTTTTNYDYILLAKINSLSPEKREELTNIINDMLDRDDTRRLVAEAFELSARSLARSWGSDNDDAPQESL